MNAPPQTPHEPYPPVADVMSRLREVLGPETAEDGPAATAGVAAATGSGVGSGVGAGVQMRMIRWWVPGVTLDTGVALRMSSAPPEPGEPPVLWVTRPGEAKPERCPIVTMEHLQGFLALLSIARRSPEPVHGHVCPGDN